jgi:hypothetical protein
MNICQGWRRLEKPDIVAAIKPRVLKMYSHCPYSTQNSECSIVLTIAIPQRKI